MRVIKMHWGFFAFFFVVAFATGLIDGILFATLVPVVTRPASSLPPLPSVPAFRATAPELLPPEPEPGLSPLPSPISHLL